MEAIFKSLIDRILRVQNSHIESPDEKAMLSRNWEFIFSDFDGWVVLHCSTKRLGGYWMYPMLCPTDRVDSVKKTLPHFNVSMSSSAYCHISSGDEHWLEPCWGKPKDFKKSEIPMFFYRQYYGYSKGEENYVEFNQIVTHPLDLHWSPTKSSYCRINSQGDEIEKIKIIKNEEVSLKLIRRNTLDKLLHLGEWALIRYFEFSRLKSESPSFESCTTRLIEPEEYEAKFELRICGDEYISFRGAQIGRPKTPKEQLLSWQNDDEEEEIKYADFIVLDWKNKKILKNYSLNPINYANYFTESALPFETSPVFFKAEVLDKYKNNPDKYELSERTITCRGGWYLQTYDINDHNQVHTYAVYLSRLPYKEQLHWLQYNEEPKGAISKRAFQTDFEGKFPEGRSRMEQLQNSLERLGKLKIEGEIIWSPKGGSWESASKGLFYVNSENPNQWHDFIIALANTTTEGFQKTSLRKIAALYGINDEKLGTLGLIKHILTSSKNEEHIPDIYGVLNDLQIRRGKGKAHGTWDTPQGSLVKDANARLQAIIQSIEKMIEVFEALKIPTHK